MTKVFADIDITKLMYMAHFEKKRALGEQKFS